MPAKKAPRRNLFEHAVFSTPSIEQRGTSMHSDPSNTKCDSNADQSAIGLQLERSMSMRDEPPRSIVWRLRGTKSLLARWSGVSTR
jgi:hypothetical protein